MSYSREDEEVRLYNANDGMSGNTVAMMGYSEEEKTIVIVYEDGNIDLLDEDDNFTQLSQFRNSLSTTFNGKRLHVSGQYALLTSQNQLVIIDLRKKEFKGIYATEYDLYCATIFKNEVWAAGDNILIRCPLTKNLRDKDEWALTEKIYVDNFVPIGDKLYCNIRNMQYPYYTGIWEFTLPDGDTMFTPRLVYFRPYYTASTADAYGAVMFNANQICILNEGDIDNYIVVDRPADISAWYSVTRDTDGTYWIAEGYNGLRQYTLDPATHTFTPTGRALLGYGARRNYAWFMRYAGDRLLVAGGRLDPYSRDVREGTIMYYENNEWGSFQEAGISDATGLVYRNITSIVQDPSDASHHFASSAGQGIYEFRNYEFVRLLNESNSALQSIIAGNPNYLRIDGVNFDSNGNLWCVNNGVERPLKVMKPDGNWLDFYVEPIDAAPTLEKTLIDSKNRVWVASRRTVNYHDAGLLCYNTNGTLDNDADDEYRYRSGGYNQDDRTVELGGVYALALDKDERLWVGTESGLYVVDNLDDWFQSDFRFTQVKIARNDGTNLADYLMAGTTVTALAVDGANRKWIGTLDNGLYVTSADGKEILAHFTSSDSGLLSDYINSIAVNENDGTIMIGTDAGICSLTSAAANPYPELQKDNIRVYPNPVRPEFSGEVTITGMTDGAEVKVVTAGGKAVYVGRANSGNFKWNVCNQNGERVGSGVYYFYISTADAKKGAVAKIIVI